MKVVAVTDDRGAVVDEALLRACEPVHRQLRPRLPADYARRMKEIFAGGGRMAVVAVGGEVAGIAVWRILEKTFTGRELYCDDLVTDEARRSTGVGHALVAHMERVARSLGCDVFALDSGVQRERAHRFYFREAMAVKSFHFSKALGRSPARPAAK